MTMTHSQIETALGQRLVTMDLLMNVAWPNELTDPARPFLHFQHVPVSWSDPTLDGNATTVRGYATVTAVTVQGVYATTANALVDQIMGWFPYGLEIEAGTGKITIMKPPEPLPPYLDGADWRSPVRIDYEAQD